MALTTLTGSRGIANGFIGPVVDGNGNIYVLTTDTGGRLTVWKSSNGGTSFAQQNTAGRPTNNATTMGSFSMRHVGTVLHIVSVTGQYTSGKNSVVDVQYHTFNTSDAGASPDTWQITNNAIMNALATPGGISQGADIAVRSDGDVIVLTVGSANKDMGTDYRQMAYSRREGGSWTTDIRLSGGIAANEDYAGLVMAPNDECHMFWGNGTNIQARTLDSANNLSTAITAFSGLGAGVMAKPVYLSDGGDRIVAAKHNSTGVQARRFQEDGSGDIATDAGEGATTVNDAAIGSFTNFGIAWDATNTAVHLLWEVADGDIWDDLSVDGHGAGWGTDTEIEDVTGTGVNNISANGYTRSGQKIGFVVRDGTEWKFGEFTPGGAGPVQRSFAGAITPAGALTTQFIDGPPLITNFCDHISAFNHLRPNGMVFAVGTEIHAAGVDWDSGNSRYRPTIAYSTDDGETWTKVNASVTDSYIIIGVDYDPDNNRIHIITVDQGPISNYYYFQFNPATKAFTVTEQSITASTAAAVAAVQGRSDGTVVALLADNGTPNAYDLWIRSSGGTWSGPTSISADDGVDVMQDPAIAIGANDRRHLFWYNSTDNDWKHRTLLSNDTFGTEQAIITVGSQSLTQHAAHLNVDSEVGLVYAKTDEIWEIIRATSADTPSWGGEETVAGGAVPIEASGNSYMLPWCMSPAAQWFFGLQYGGGLSILYDRDGVSGWGTDIDTGVDARYPWDNDTGTVSRGSFIVREGTDGNTYLGWLMSIPGLTGAGFSSYQEVLLSTALALAGSVTPAGAVIKAAEKILAGASTPAGTATKSTATTFAGTITPTSVLTNLTLRTLALAGSIASAGVHTANVLKTVAGTITPAGAVTRSISKLVAGVLTSAGDATTRLVSTILVSGVLSFVGTRTARIPKDYAGTLTPAGDLTKSSPRTFTASIASTGAVARSTGKLVDGTITPAGTVANIRLRLIALAGSIAAAGAALLRTATTKTASITPAGDVSRETSTTKAGTINPAGTVTKTTATTLTASITPTGALTTAATKLLALAGSIASIVGNVSRETQKTITATVASAGAVTLITRKTLVASIASAGARTGRALINLAGSIASAGDSSHQIQTGTFQRSFAGSIAMAGALLLRASQTLDASITPTGSVSRQTATTKGGAVTPAGGYGPTVVGKTVGGAVTPAGAVSRFIATTLNGTIGPAAALTSKITKLLSGALTSVGAVTLEVNPGTFTITVGGTLTMAGVRLARVSRALDGVLSPTAALTKASTQTHTATITPGPGDATKTGRFTFSGAITPTGGFSAIRTILVALAGAVTSTGDLLRAVSSAYSGALTPTGTVVRVVSTTVTGTIAMAGTVTRTTRRYLTAAISLAGAVTTQVFNVLAGPISKLVRGQGNATGRVHSQSEAGTIRHQGRTGRNIDT